MMMMMTITVIIIIIIIKDNKWEKLSIIKNHE